MAHTACKILGVAFLIAGLVGFVMPHFLGFHLTTIHNLVHLATAAVALYLGFAGSLTAARTFCLVFGAVYALLGVLDVHATGPDWARLDKWIQEWRPDGLVVGDPATLDGGEQPIRERARGFARELGRRYRLPVQQVDERQSSIEAAQRFAAGRAAGARRRHQAAQLDALAAVVILERWLAEPDSRVPLSAEPQK
jgi:putative Holliday junction resolvase